MKQALLGLIMTVAVIDVGADAKEAPGWPSRDPDLDALPGFKNPPPGYGEVPFWWWNGENLDVDRLLWQVQELHEKGISGVKVNYSHLDTPGWVNGQRAGVRVAPPWKLGLDGLLQAGENEFEVLVYNTLANHYQTIPSLYRGSPESGLLGPVRLRVEK